jgi:hypothetical protein
MTALLAAVLLSGVGCERAPSPDPAAPAGESAPASVSASAPASAGADRAAVTKTACQAAQAALVSALNRFAQKTGAGDKAAARAELTALASVLRTQASADVTPEVRAALQEVATKLDSMAADPDTATAAARQALSSRIEAACGAGGGGY